MINSPKVLLFNVLGSEKYNNHVRGMPHTFTCKENFM